MVPDAGRRLRNRDVSPRSGDFLRGGGREPGRRGRETSRPHVIVLGGGFGGVGAALGLAGADVDVTLIDRNDYHTFQPLLYQVATDLLETVGRRAIRSETCSTTSRT